MATISLSGLDKAEVLAALYNAAKPQGLGFLHYNPSPMTVEEARQHLAGSTYFDYLQGRVMKVNLSGDELESRSYDRDNGEGTAERVINALRVTGEVNPEEVEHHHLEMTRESAVDLGDRLHEETAFSEEGGIPTIRLGFSDFADELNDILDALLDDDFDLNSFLNDGEE